MRRMGMPVWSVINIYFAYEKDRNKVLKSYSGWLTLEELEAALAFYRDNPEEIERKLYEIAN